MKENVINEALIICVSAYDSNNDIQLIKQTGAEGYLSKPFELIELYEIL